MRYSFIARAVDGQRYQFEGKKLARPGRDQWHQGRTLYVSVGRVGAAPSFTGTLVVPPDSYVREQIDGITVSASATAQERTLAKFIWLAWFNAQFGLAFSEPILRSLVQLVDAARGTAFHKEAP
jgi:hypothetical protein